MGESRPIFWAGNNRGNSVDHFRFNLASQYSCGNCRRHHAGTETDRPGIEITNSYAYDAGDMELWLRHDHARSIAGGKTLLVAI